jgi:hypothetical protein
MELVEWIEIINSTSLQYVNSNKIKKPITIVVVASSIKKKNK